MPNRLVILTLALGLVASGCVLIVAPGANESVTAPVTLAGFAKEEGGVDSVRLWIKDMTSNQYWNAAGESWQNAWIEFQPEVQGLGGVTASWEYLFDPTGTSGSGNYRLRGVSYDNGQPSEIVTRSFTVVDDPNVVFFDDFDSPTLDPAKWKATAGDYGSSNGERDQCYTTRPSNVRIENGLLILTAIPEAPPASEWCHSGQTHTSGMINSNDIALPAVAGYKGNLGFNQGRFEMRSRMSDRTGYWPAFWLRPVESFYGPWPRSGEIDIMEYPGSAPSSATRGVFGGIHYWDSALNRRVNPHDHIPVGAGEVETWHIYRLDWTDSGLKFYYDNQLIKSVPYSSAAAPFDRDFFITLTFQVGGSWPGSPIDPAPGATWEVDWIRVSELT